MLKNFMTPAPKYMMYGQDGQVILGQPAGGTVFTNDLYGGKPSRVSSMSGYGDFVPPYANFMARGKDGVTYMGQNAGGMVFRDAVGTHGAGQTTSMAGLDGMSSLGGGGPYGASQDPTKDEHHQAPPYVLDIHNYNSSWVVRQLRDEGWDQYFGETPDYLYAMLSRKNMDPQQSWWALIRGKYAPAPAQPADCSSVPSDISWQDIKDFGGNIGISNFVAWMGETPYETACRLLNHRQVMLEAQAELSASQQKALYAPAGSSMSAQGGAQQGRLVNLVYPGMPSGGHLLPPANMNPHSIEYNQGPMVQPMDSLPSDGGVSSPPSQPAPDAFGPRDRAPMIGPRDGIPGMNQKAEKKRVIQNIWEALIISFFKPRANEILPSMTMTPSIENVISQNADVLRSVVSNGIPNPGSESPAIRAAITKIASVMMTDKGVRAIMQDETFPVASYYAELASTGRSSAPVPPSGGVNKVLLLGAGVIGAGILWYLMSGSEEAAG